jgi:hypothetical protein
LTDVRLSSLICGARNGGRAEQRCQAEKPDVQRGGGARSPVACVAWRFVEQRQSGQLPVRVPQQQPPRQPEQQCWFPCFQYCPRPESCRSTEGRSALGESRPVPGRKAEYRSSVGRLVALAGERRPTRFIESCTFPRPRSGYTTKPRVAQRTLGWRPPRRRQTPTGFYKRGRVDWCREPGWGSTVWGISICATPLGLGFWDGVGAPGCCATLGCVVQRLRRRDAAKRGIRENE